MSTENFSVPPIPLHTCEACSGSGKAPSGIGDIECQWCNGSGTGSINRDALKAQWRYLHQKLHDTFIRMKAAEKQVEILEKRINVACAAFCTDKTDGSSAENMFRILTAKSERIKNENS